MPVNSQYPMLSHFLGKHQGFTATFMSAIQTVDSPMPVVGKRMKFAYLDGNIWGEKGFSEQWTFLSALARPDTNAITHAGMDVSVELYLPGKKKQYFIFPKAKMCSESELSEETTLLGKNAFKVTRAADGTEIIDGHPCVKSKISFCIRSQKKIK